MPYAIAEQTPQPTDTAAISHSFFQIAAPSTLLTRRAHPRLGGMTVGQTPAVTGGRRQPTYPRYSLAEFIESPCSCLEHVGTRQVGPKVR